MLTLHTKFLVHISLYFKSSFVCLTDDTICLHDKPFCGRSLTLSIGIFRLVGDDPLWMRELRWRLQQSSHLRLLFLQCESYKTSQHKVIQKTPQQTTELRLVQFYPYENKQTNKSSMSIAVYI